MPSLVGRLLGRGGSTASAPDAPSIAFSSRTTTTITLTHTPPADTTDYTQTRIYYGPEGGAALGSSTSSTAQSVVFSGLTAGTRYWFVAVSESSGPDPISSPAPPVFVYTLFSAGTAKASQIKAAIKTIMAAVPGMDSATIHTRERRPHGYSPSDISTLLQSSSTYNGWVIEEDAAASVFAARSNGWAVTDQFRIHGFYAWDDSANSEGTFRALLQEVMEALNSDASLSGTVRYHGTIQLRQYGFQHFGNDVFHFADLGIECRYYQEV